MFTPCLYLGSPLMGIQFQTLDGSYRWPPRARLVSSCSLNAVMKRGMVCCRFFLPYNLFVTIISLVKPSFSTFLFKKIIFILKFNHLLNQVSWIQTLKLFCLYIMEKWVCLLLLFSMISGQKLVMVQTILFQGPNVSHFHPINLGSVGHKNKLSLILLKLSS